MEMVTLQEIRNVCVNYGEYEENQVDSLLENWKTLLRFVTYEMRQGFLMETVDNFSTK